MNPTTRISFPRISGRGLLPWLLVVMAAPASAARPNVLFIAVDDLRPQLGCYGESWIQSPNLDRLAQSGLRFDRAYCQQAICMSSRASLLSGYRPDHGRIYNNGPLFEHVPDALTLNQHFLNHGYETVSLGKIYHHGGDKKQGWSRPAWQPEGDWSGRGYLAEASRREVARYEKQNPGAKRQGMGPAFEAPEVDDEAYADGKIATRAIGELRRLAKGGDDGGTPFFLAVGFMKPHLPFNAPRRYWDLYDPRKIPLAPQRSTPKGAPKPARTGWGELRGYQGMPRSGAMPADSERELIHGYAACVSYVDAMIGRVLDELEKLGLEDDTIVVLWGDHGFKLGDLGMWCKHTNFERDTRVPLIVRAPGMKARGKSTPALTELVDLYPTLCELAGLELPGHLEGTSFAPLLDDPSREWKSAAFSQYPRGSVMGYTMRTRDHRYTEWRKLKGGEVVARELYDHRADPEEADNLAGDPKSGARLKEFAARLRAGPQAARPPWR
ncbi:sulfatase [Haloferula sp. A504]|uniref:sulfatase n=1 Tax=Haloferula sp. A504 TaxID=3373601 RepID=UPI0031C14D0E|nr:sulfatase [Verrucomicrobiaceae bacterium E54]